MRRDTLGCLLAIGVFFRVLTSGKVFGVRRFATNVWSQLPEQKCFPDAAIVPDVPDVPGFFHNYRRLRELFVFCFVSLRLLCSSKRYVYPKKHREHREHREQREQVKVIISNDE